MPRRPAEEENVSAYYPLFLNLNAKACLVVGGGMVAERKVQGLLEARASVIVVSPTLTATLYRLVDEGVIAHVPRSFHNEDVAGCALVIGATDDAEVNACIAMAARQRGIPVNIVDTPELCDFIAPSVLRRGDVQIAISTGGRSPTLAKRLRQGLEVLIGPEYGELAGFLGRLRTALRRRETTPAGRKALFERLIEASGLPLIAHPPVLPSRVRRVRSRRQRYPHAIRAGRP